MSDRSLFLARDSAGAPYWLSVRRCMIPIDNRNGHGFLLDYFLEIESEDGYRVFRVEQGKYVLLLNEAQAIVVESSDRGAP